MFCCTSSKIGFGIYSQRVRDEEGKMKTSEAPTDEKHLKTFNSGFGNYFGKNLYNYEGSGLHHVSDCRHQICINDERRKRFISTTLTQK